MRFRPTSLERFTGELAGVLAERAGTGRLRVAVDGAPAARPGVLADALVDPLRVRGHEALRVSAWDFLRPASVRLERGKTDPDARYSDWLDAGAVDREVLRPLAPGGSGRVLPALWDAERDRAVRAEPRPLPPGGVLIMDGELLLGRGLPFDHTVHLWLSAAALARRTEDALHWALPAYQRYEREVDPRRMADAVLRVDDPEHPAELLAAG